jgi:bifunctional DNase/RNase
LTFTDGTRTIGLDARTSDAIAIAMRADAPIYTTQAIVDETGIELEEVEDNDQADGDSDFETPEESEGEQNEEQLTDDELEDRLSQLIDEENYEEAARISAILKKRRQ